VVPPVLARYALTGRDIDAPDGRGRKTAPRA
jgi:hypothetical protein